MSRSRGLRASVRRAIARPVPHRGDRWIPLDPVGVVHVDARDLHLPPGHPGDADGFVAAAAPRSLVVDGLLDLGRIRCDLGTDPSEVASVVVGALRGRRGRPLRGAGALLDLPRPGRHRRRRRVLEVDGTVGVLDLRGRSATNYFHLLVDALANRWLVERLAGPAAPDRWLLPVGTTPWQAEVLALAGLDAALLRPGDADRVLATRFLVPVRGLGSRHVPDWIVTALRAVGGPAPDPVDAPPLLHVTRGDAPRRRLRGEELLSDGLARLGFETVAADRLTVAEQRRRFGAADVVVAAHGAALTNLAWARSGATVVELLPAARPNLAYRRLAAQAGVRHVGIICPPAGAERGPHADLGLDVPTALRVIEGVMAGTT